jgi:hypothetical protein
MKPLELKVFQLEARNLSRYALNEHCHTRKTFHSHHTFFSSSFFKSKRVKKSFLRPIFFSHAEYFNDPSCKYNIDFPLIYKNSKTREKNSYLAPSKTF